jgi:hypothetical protein
MKVAKGKINKFLQGLNWFLKHGKLYIHTVKSRAVDWSTIQFWIFCPKVTVHKHQISPS